MNTKNTMWMGLLAIGLALTGCGITANSSDELANDPLVDDVGGKADLAAQPFGKWSDLNNSGDLEIQSLDLRNTNSFDGQRWNIDFCPDDSEPSTCSEDFSGTFSLKKSASGKRVLLLDEAGAAKPVRYFYEVTGKVLKLREVGVSAWTKLSRG